MNSLYELGPYRCILSFTRKLLGNIAYFQKSGIVFYDVLVQ